MRGELSSKTCQNMHETLVKNYRDYLHLNFSLDDMIAAMKKDKKNTSNKLTLILPRGEKAKIEKLEVVPNDIFRDQCKSFFSFIKP